MAYDVNIVNTFEGGMVQDSLNYLQPKGTYRFARNMVKGDRHSLGYGLSTEESTRKITAIGKVVGAYYVESIDGTIFFTMDGSIKLFDHDTQKVTHVVTDSEFGCDWGFDQCNYISATFKTDQPCNELKVYFSSGCDYYVVNITEMLNEARKEGLKAAITGTNQDKCALNCDYFRIFKCVCQPTITPITSDRGGHRLVSGSYQFVAQLEDNGGNKTNWYTVSDPVSVESENNQPGELSLASIKVHITDLDCRYDKVNIAVIKSVEGNITAQIVATRHYSSQGITFTYVGQVGRDISLLEIQAKKKMFLKGNDVAQKDSRLFLYGIRSEKNLNMQQRVLNEAKLSFIEIETTPEMVRRHGMRTYERGENYMFAVVYNYCDGTNSVAFPMKPNGAAGACGGGAGFSGTSIQPASGDGVKVERPRGGPNAEGATLGCSTGRCGGGGTSSGGETETRASSGDEVTNGVLEEIQDWQTDIPNLVNAATCDECTEPWCCDDADHPTGEVSCVDCGYGKCAGCVEDEQAIANEVPNIQNIIGSNTDELIYGIQDKDPQYDSYTFKTAAEKLIESVNNAEFVVVKKDDIKVNTKGGGTSGGGQSVASEEGEARGEAPSANTSPSASWSDEYTDGKGVYLLDEEPNVVGCFAPETKLSTELYPDSVDCNGELYFGGLANTPIQLFRTPTADKSPIIKDTSLGVPSEHSNVDPIKAVKVRLLGIQAQVPQPQEGDLPKPLCPNNPWSIVTIARDEINSTVQAKGIMFGTMTGLSGTETYIYGRHAANSRCHMDRWIDNGGSRFGSINGPGVMFYGLDTEIGKVGLSGRKLRTELKVAGIGYRYNLYEKGEEPKEALTGRRVDQRGATQTINLNVVTPQAAELDIAALGYINADQGAQAVSGAKHNVVSLHRESSVYIEAPLSMPTDSSFTPDTLNHSAPIPDAYGVYGAVVRDIEDQYGAISGMTFIKTGLEGRGWGTYKGVCGDTFIGPMSFIRKSFVSDKVGNTYKTPERDRTVCDSPNDLTLQNLGIDFYSTQLPLTGDRSDAKNWAGGYADKFWWQAYSNPPEEGKDFYYPKVQKTLITTWIESRINPWLRATGYGDAKETGEVFYPKLKGLHLAASSSKTKHPWEKSFINRFYFKVEQPSVGQLTRKAIVKNVIAILMPMLGLSELNDLTGVPDTVATLLTSPILIAYWYMLKNLVTRSDYLDRMLGLPVCKTDAAGGESDNGIENFENNYYAYNYDHSALNYANVYPAIPTNYNTCSCDSCEDKDNTNEIYYSNKQIQGSPIDFYKQFGALSFESLPADLGRLTKLLTVNGKLFAQTTDFTIPLEFRDVSQGALTMGNAALGGYLTLANPDSPLFEGVTEGLLGNLDPNAGINTPMGYIFIDRQARKVYLFDGSGAPTALSSIGLDRFFKEHLDFCELGACHDEKKQDSTYYSLGYDPLLNRVLLTKKALGDKESFTISLDLSSPKPSWVSLHDYVPQLYFWDRKNMYAVKDETIHLHNAGDGTYRTFYDTEYPSQVEFVALQDGISSFVYKETFINTEAEKDQRKNLDDTFNKIAAYNTTQGTGTTNFVVHGDNKNSDENMSKLIVEGKTKKLHKVRRGFRTNEIKDNTKKSCKEEPMTLREKCNPTEEINEQMFDCTPHAKQNFNNAIMLDDHLTYRMTYDRDNKTLLKLLNVITSADKDNQK
jgi:hypothetical protein